MAADPYANDKYQPGFTIVRQEGPFLYVAVVGYNHDWTAYQGPDFYGALHIAAQGDKMSRVQAEQLFPDLAASGLKWRY